LFSAFNDQVSPVEAIGGVWGFSRVILSLWHKGLQSLLLLLTCLFLLLFIVLGHNFTFPIVGSSHTFYWSTAYMRSLLWILKWWGKNVFVWFTKMSVLFNLWVVSSYMYRLWECASPSNLFIEEVKSVVNLLNSCWLFVWSSTDRLCIQKSAYWHVICVYVAASLSLVAQFLSSSERYLIPSLTVN
jgi:hypothetical protein